MAQRRQLLIEEFLVTVRRIGRLMQADRGNCFREFNLHPAQVGLLHFVQQNGTATMKDIAGALGTTHSAVTQLIEGIVKAGYLVRIRDQRDRRIIHLKLSTKGTSKFEQFRKGHFAMMRSLLTPLTDREIATLIVIQKKMFGHARQADTARI